MDKQKKEIPASLVQSPYSSICDIRKDRRESSDIYLTDLHGDKRLAPENKQDETKTHSNYWVFIALGVLDLLWSDTSQLAHIVFGANWMNTAALIILLVNALILFTLAIKTKFSIDHPPADNRKLVRDVKFWGSMLMMIGVACIGGDIATIIVDPSIGIQSNALKVTLLSAAAASLFIGFILNQCVSKHDDDTQPISEDGRELRETLML